MTERHPPLPPTSIGMSWFTTHLRAKLLAGFGVVLAVMVGIIALGLSSVGSVASKADDMAKTDLPSAKPSAPSAPTRGFSASSS